MNSDKSLSSLPSSSPLLGSQGVRGASEAPGARAAERAGVLVTASPGPSGRRKGQPRAGAGAAPKDPKARIAPGELGSQKSFAPGSPAPEVSSAAPTWLPWQPRLGLRLSLNFLICKKGRLPRAARAARRRQRRPPGRVSSPGSRAQGWGGRAHSNALPAVWMLMRLAGRGMKAGPPFAQ